MAAKQGRPRGAKKKAGSTLGAGVKRQRKQPSKKTGAKGIHKSGPGSAVGGGSRSGGGSGAASSSGALPEGRDDELLHKLRSTVAVKKVQRVRRPPPGVRSQLAKAAGDKLSNVSLKRLREEDEEEIEALHARRTKATSGIIQCKLDAVATKCMRTRCPNVAAGATKWGAWKVDDTGNKVWLGPACFECALSWRKNWRLYGSLGELFTDLNEDAEGLDREFQDTTDIRLGVKVREHLPSEVSHGKQYGLEIEVHVRGLSERDFVLRFEQVPSFFGLILETLLGVSGLTYQGVVLREHWSLFGLGVLYKYKTFLGSQMWEIWLDRSDHNRIDAHEAAWEELTTPSLQEAKEVKQLRAMIKAASSVLDLDAKRGVKTGFSLGSVDIGAHDPNRGFQVGTREDEVVIPGAAPPAAHLGHAPTAGVRVSRRRLRVSIKVAAAGSSKQQGGDDEDGDRESQDEGEEEEDDRRDDERYY
jgi:hypothetical protein